MIATHNTRTGGEAETAIGGEDRLDAFYAKLSPKELRRQIQNDEAIRRAGSLSAAYGKNRARVVPGRGEWAGTFWCLKGDIADGPFARTIDAVNHGRRLDGLPQMNGFPK